MRKISLFKYKVSKTMATVQCLCRLHNFLINERLSHEQARNEESENINEDVPMVTAVDNMHLNMHGAVPMEERDPVHAPGQLMPVQLMDVGHHRDDDQRGLMRMIEKRKD